MMMRSCKHWFHRLAKMFKFIRRKQDKPTRMCDHNLLRKKKVKSARFYDSFSSAMYSNIPVIIPCFNNFTYVRSMVEQLRARGMRQLILIDNGSTYQPLLSYLENESGELIVIKSANNNGPRHVVEDEISFSLLPDVFILTDPDLMLNSEMPEAFVRELLDISECHRIGKVGLALEIVDKEKMVTTEFEIGGQNYKIWDWESPFWEHPIGHSKYGDTIFRAPIDTTFALYNKRYFVQENFFMALRVAGKFTCRHLPWYVENQIPSEELDWYRRHSKHSFYLKQ